MDKTTHFGFSNIPIEEKTGKVAAVFESVANKYDLMNDLMSFGVHRLWKRFALSLCNVKQGHCVLDLAGGTGDLAGPLSAMTGPEGQTILADINGLMLEQGRSRMLDKGITENISYIQLNAEHLPFANNSFNCVTMAFGLRNVTDKGAAVRSVYDVLKPGGQFLILEFSKPVIEILEKSYDMYSFNIIPKLGRWITHDEDSYTYLVESIRMHPDQETLKALLENNGFERVEYFNLSGGIVALHRGYKF